MCVSFPFRWLLYLFALVALPLGAQDTLRIVDPGGEPVPFVYVYTVPDSTVVGVADLDGMIVLDKKKIDRKTLSLSSIGYGDNETTYARLRENGFVYRMRAGSSLLATMVVVGRRNEAFTELNQQVGIISRAEIARAQSLTTADALADLGGVYVQKSQFGGGSPVVRGFEANRVLLVVDGVRMNNAIFRSGHLQNAITVDPLALDRIELLYGAGALAYGSDALGGVVHFRTEQPQYVTKGAGPQDAVNGRIALTYASAANAVTFGSKLGYGAKNWAGLTSLSLSSTSHLRAGARRPDRFPRFGLRNRYTERRDGSDLVIENDDPNVQVGTAYDQYNLLQKFRFRLSDKVELAANFQYSTTSDVPRYDALTESDPSDGDFFRWARWDYGPQTRALAALTLSDRRATSLYDVATYLLSYQHVKEDRITRRFGSPWEENNQEDVRSLNLQTDFTKELSPFLTFRYGADLRYDAVESTAFIRTVNEVPPPTNPIATRYPSQGSSLAAAGAYAEARYEFGTDWALRGGVRVGRQRLSATFGPNDPVDWPQVYLDGVNNTESAATASFGIQGNGLRLLYAQGFRAPNIDDFAKFRENNGFIQVPNLNLQPERSQTLEAAYRLGGKPRGRSNKFTAELTAYHTWLRNAIIRSDGALPDGSTTFESGGQLLRAQTNVNAESARIYGADLVVRYVMANGWALETDLHYLRGRREQQVFSDQTMTLPQDHIPPPYGSTRLTWSVPKWTVGLRFRYQLDKRVEDYAVSEVIVGGDGLIFDRRGTSDNLELTPFLNDESRFAGAYGWWTANLSAEYAPTERWTFRLKADNLLDKHYRTFASGVSAPGIDVGGGVTWTF